MRLRRTGLFLAPSLGIVLALLIAPLVLLLVISFWQVRSFKLRPALSLDAWERFFVNYGSLTLYTLAIGLAAAVVSVALPDRKGSSKTSDTGKRPGV